MSAPARRARTAASGTVWSAVMAGSARSSVIATPWKCSSRRSRPVTTSVESEAGTVKSLNGIERVPDDHDAGTPASIAAWNGQQVARRSSSRPSPTVAGPSSVDWSAEPRPGKCAAALNTCSAR